jgi:iron-sulfur cluster repair protein YtfE (RIC family)
MTLVDNSEGLPGQHDVVEVLLAQHGRVRELIAEVIDAQGEERRRPFDELRTLLAVHEAAEESIVHPVSHQTDDGEVADARIAEEHDAAKEIAHLESMDISGPEFAEAFAAFAQAVAEHAEKEESEEFPALRRDISAQDLRAMAGRVMTGQEDALIHMGERTPNGADAEAEPFSDKLDQAATAMKPV